MSYRDDVRNLRDGEVEDGAMRFSKRARVPAEVAA
jgi:hypothetical protein